MGARKKSLVGAPAREPTPWFGAVHALGALVIFGTTGWLMASASRRHKAG